MKDLLARFIAAFKRGIDGELAAMHAAAEAFEIPLTRGEDLGTLRFSFELAAGERLQPGTVCSLRTPRGDQRVAIERCEDARVTLVATQPLDVSAAPFALVVAPWFLYDRMLAALDELEPLQFSIGTALRLFGKQPHEHAATILRCDHGELDASQRAAVQLCSDSDLAFIWGPPGTGKTVTLAHVVEELLAQGQRILLVSTTNAAIDQLLAKLATRAFFAPGLVVRLGRSAAETFGAELGDIVESRHGVHRATLEKLRSRVGEVVQQIRFARALVADLATAVVTQGSLFGEPVPRLRSGALSRVFTDGLADAVAARPPSEQLRAIESRIARLERVQVLTKARIADHAAADRDLAAKIVTDARIVMCTLTNAHLSPAMIGQRFDALIAEEAGMAILPALFYAASLCRRRAIVVGDPRQLPPIVQSNDELVRRSIGRNIFDVTIPDPAHSEVVAMLETQYRMHPAIGALVGKLFYGGRLIHRALGTEAIVARAPFPGQPIAIVDTTGTTTCERSNKGSSRLNRASAEITADLALEAIRAGNASVGVITPYAAQAAEIRKALAARAIGDVVECSTIHRFQGRECDVVIIDLVDAPPLRPSGLVTDAPNLLNVSVSRARGKLVIVADVRHFDGLVAELLREARA